MNKYSNGKTPRIAVKQLPTRKIHVIELIDKIRRYGAWWNLQTSKIRIYKQNIHNYKENIIKLQREWYN